MEEFICSRPSALITGHEIESFLIHKGLLIKTSLKELEDADELCNDNGVDRKAKSREYRD